MAKVQNNIFVRGLSGSVGEQFVVRRGRGGNTVIANKPSFSPEREFNPNQLAHQKAFKQAIAYAKSAKAEEIYITKAQGTTMTAFNAAVADWFNEPEVLEINAENWSGAIGQTILIEAHDDTQVVRVRIQIMDAQGNVLEQGDAERGQELWWTYTTMTAIADPATASIKATAYDLPGNTHALVWSNN